MKTQRVIYEFDGYRVDSGQFLLTRYGRRQPITPTVFRILLVLLENASREVTKTELMSSIWPDSYVEEGNLNRNVSTLRKILGEKPHDHRYIETIPKTGYRFVAPVRRTDHDPVLGEPSVNVLSTRRRIVGRETERARLRENFDAAKNGRGGILCVSGEFGIGKSAVVDRFISDLANAGEVFHLTGVHCSRSNTEPEPFGPFLECLSCFRKAPAISELIRSTAPSWHIEITHGRREVVPHATRMTREVVELLQQMSAVHPVVMVIDDFHWADLASVDLLTSIAAKLSTMRVLIIVCVRPEELRIHRHPFATSRTQLVCSGLLNTISVAPLGRDEVVEYLALEFPSKNPELADFVLARSEGNPLFMTELLRDIDLARAQGKVPEPIRDLIQNRLGYLQEPERTLLAAASVQGFEFDSAILAVSLGWTAETVEEHLQAIAETHDLIRRCGEEQTKDGRLSVRYSFTHSLYQIVCHQTLLPTRKALLNAAVAEAFMVAYSS